MEFITHAYNYPETVRRKQKQQARAQLSKISHFFFLFLDFIFQRKQLELCKYFDIIPAICSIQNMNIDFIQCTCTMYVLLTG